MTEMKLDGLRVAILATDGFEESELVEPMRALREAGAHVTLIAPKQGAIKGKRHAETGESFPVDLALDEARPEDFDALLLPGGVANPDKLRMDRRAVSFVRDMFTASKPIAAICHAGWMLVEADVVRGRRLTSYPSLQTDIRNAGGDWIDEEVVSDQGLVTSRRPDDIPAFNAKMIEEFAKGRHARRFSDSTAGAEAAAAAR